MGLRAPGKEDGSYCTKDCNILLRLHRASGESNGQENTDLNAKRGGLLGGFDYLALRRECWNGTENGNYYITLGPCEGDIVGIRKYTHISDLSFGGN